MTSGNILDKVIPIYSGKREDFTWVGFGSGSGTNLRECAKVISPSLVFSDRVNPKLFGLEELASAEHKRLNTYQMKGGESWRNIKDNPEKVAEYERKALEADQEIVNILKEHEDKIGKPIDLIVLGGYMSLIRQPILNAYKDKIINVHPSSLPVNMDGNLLDNYNPRRFIGDDAVYDALKEGVRATTSSVIIVDDEVDHGEILVQGNKVRAWGEILMGSNELRNEALREYADAHQTVQKVRSDWPAMRTALDLIADRRLALGTEKSHFDEWRTVYIDGKPLPYEGLQLEK